MKLHTLNKLTDGRSVLSINLLDEIMLDDAGRIIGIAHTGRKFFKSYGSEESFRVMKDYYGHEFKGQMILITPEITISNWNNTLWDAH